MDIPSYTFVTSDQIGIVDYVIRFSYVVGTHRYKFSYVVGTHRYKFPHASVINVAHVKRRANKVSDIIVLIYFNDTVYGYFVYIIMIVTEI